MLTAAASLLLIAWLPGAVVFRLPVGGRERRAALPADERLFWQVVISLVVSHATVLGLAAAHRYSFTRLLIADAALAAVLASLARFRLRLGARPPGASALVVAGLIALSVPRFFPPAEYVMGGKDPGTYINEGIVIAQRGTLVYDDPTVASVPESDRDLFFPSHQRPDYYGTRFMGFFVQDPATGAVVGQFPHFFPASIAIGYGIDGLTGARRAGAVWATLGIIAVYLAGARWLGRTAAAAAAALLALNVIEVWYGRIPNAEVTMQALVFAALLANARGHFDGADPDRFFATLAGALLGLLLFLRFDAVLAIVGVVAANLIAGVRGHRTARSFILVLIGTTAVAAAYLLGPMRAYAALPVVFISNLRWWHVLLIAAAVCGLGGVLAIVRQRPEARRTVEEWLPSVLVLLVWTLAVYAFFLRAPGGKLTLENAYALRMYASFYVTVPCLAAALAGYALVTRRRFWHDPAIIIVITIFSIFFFYKIRIVAEHFWAARRFLPVILPGTLLLACAAATWGLRERSPRRRLVSGALGLVFIGLLGLQYARASSAIDRHVEYAGLIPRLEQLAARIGDRDLLLVESRDAGSDAHVFALPLAYIYVRNVLVLSTAAPDPARLAAFLEWARTRYDRVYFLGGGGTALLSKRWSASPIVSERFQVPEYASTLNAYPLGVRQKEFDFGLYALLPPATENKDIWFDLDVGIRDDLHVVRFHAKEVADGRTIRWSQDQSFVVITTIGAGAREVLLTMSNGGRPPGPPPADVSVYLNERLLGTARVDDGFRPYSFAVPAALAEAAAASDTPARLTIRTPAWNPHHVLGTGDSRELGVMVDRVQVR
jgi:dolichyl-phosphate-mannose-protein mannosyltransferase